MQLSFIKEVFKFFVSENFISQNEYNELSQLQTKKVGGAVLGSGLQTVDYTTSEDG
ncbi:hypothetical protein [uncultured Chryseobacterium sp.]|uniref:hypothetical protein n=1 Tax=uncultured Chryseobacterium sp. TaxID=259322 RepID=UPI0025883BA3|nr:hypothetical protein [uncultured Chryseobacterium sp.]